MAHWHSPCLGPLDSRGRLPWEQKGALPEAPVPPSEAGQALLRKRHFLRCPAVRLKPCFIWPLQCRWHSNTASRHGGPFTCAQAETLIGLALLAVKAPGNVNRSPPALGAGIRSYGTAPRICPQFICLRWPQTPWLLMYSAASLVPAITPKGHTWPQVGAETHPRMLRFKGQDPSS